MSYKRSKMKNRLRRICNLLILSICGSWAVIFVYGSKLNTFQDYIPRTIKGPIQYDDPELIRYIRHKILEPPSNEYYNLLPSASKFVGQSEILYSNFTKLLFGSKRHGFFVEAGALDGQTMSNTLSLEMKQGWTGLLIEPDPSSYNMLKRRHRKAWSANACLSIEQYPVQEKLSSMDVVSMKFKDRNIRAMGSIVHEFPNHTIHTKSLSNDETSNSYYVAQCLPLGSFLLALNVTRVDLLSLDVEFVEDKVLQHIDFNKFDIQVIFLEFYLSEKLGWLHKFMVSKGYDLIGNFNADFVFVKKENQH